MQNEKSIYESEKEMPKEVSRKNRMITYSKKAGIIQNAELEIVEKGGTEYEV